MSLFVFWTLTFCIWVHIYTHLHLCTKAAGRNQLEKLSCPNNKDLDDLLQKSDKTKIIVIDPKHVWKHV